MPYPSWVLEKLKDMGLVSLRGSQQPLDPFVQEIVSSLRGWTNIEVCPCETSRASIDILINRRTSRALAWDSRYFQYLDAVFDIAIAEPELNSIDNLGRAYLARTADKCASRLLQRSPKYAFAAKQIQLQIIGANKIEPVIILNQARRNTLHQIVRIWHVLHEVGHEVYQTTPMLVGNIDDKLKTILAALEKRQYAELFSPLDQKNLFRAELAKKGIVKTMTSRLASIRKIIAGTLDIPREEIWCDIFASEQLVLQLITRNIDHADAYLVLMLIYYSTATDLAADLFFNPSLSTEEYKLTMMPEPMAARADLRSEMLSASFVEFVLRPRGLDVTQATEDWVGTHYKTLARLAEIETMSMKYLSPDFRAHVLRLTDEAYAKLDLLARERQQQEAYKLLRWDIPLM
jgi:hypothetical protein